MKKYLLEYVYMNNSLLHKQYAVVEAENPKKAVSRLLKKSAIDIREMRGNKTIGDNLIYDIL